MLEIRTHALPTGGFVNTFTDITERYRHAEALRASERWIRLITDQVPALIAYLSDELVYEFTNKVYEEWYRWPSGSMLGRCLRDVHGAEHCRRLEPYFERALAGESVTFEIAETALSGEERYMQRSYVPNRQADGRVAGLFVLIRDITERRRTAEALHQAYQNLEQRVRERTAELTTLNDQFKREIHERSQVEARLREAKREAEQANLSKTKFLAAVSHDLLQPLNAARLFTSALQERGSAARDNEALVNNISHSLEDVENLLGTLVDISKLDAGVITPDIAPFELGELLGNLAAEYRQVAASEGLRLDFVACGALVRSDQQLLARILRNLLSNAIRYTREGACCWVAAGIGSACRSRSGTPGWASPPTSSARFSRNSSAASHSVVTRTAGSAWDWRSSTRSPACSATGSGSARCRARAHVSPSRYRWPAMPRAVAPSRWPARTTCASACVVRGCGCWTTMRRSAQACARCSKPGAAG